MDKSYEIRLEDFVRHIEKDEMFVRRGRFYLYGKIKGTKIPKPLLEENKQLLLNYYREKSSNHMKATSLYGMLPVLRRFLLFVNKPATEVTKEDVMNYLEDCKKNGNINMTIENYKIKLKSFYKWINNGKEPECVSWMEIRLPVKIKTPEMMLTDEEIKRMIDVADNPRDKALIMSLIESGCRIGEFKELNIGDLQFDNYGCLLTVRISKTVSRVIRLVTSSPYLQQWLNNHPLSKDPKAPLWCITSNYHPKRFGTSMGKTAIYLLVKKLGKLAKIEKRVFPHLARYTRASQISKVLPEQVVKKIMGWSPDSRMLKNYVALNNQQIDDEVLKKYYGIEVKENGHKPSEELKPIICKHCGMFNPKTNVFCFKCLKTIHTENSFLELVNDNDELLEKLIEKKLNQILKERGLS